MGKIFFAINILLIFSALTAGNAAGQAYSGHEEARYVPTEANLASRQEFREAGLGIFIHWGVYSMLGDGEWVLNNQDIDYKEYEKLAGGFCPAGFDAEEWVKAIKGSGAKYICFTARHHDGFSMFGSEYTDYDITDATPFGRDIVKELAEACHEEGLRLHLYYSLIDWGREDTPRGRTGKGTGRPEGSTDTTAYCKLMKGQLSELLGNYGEIGAIWFDGDWDMPEGYDWRYDELYPLIHGLQPSCLIGNNHHRNPIEGEDIQIFERDLPGENLAGYSGAQDVSTSLPLETCQTMGASWGYDIHDDEYKSAEELIHYLVNAAGRGDIPPRDWGATTRKGNRLYIHILNFQDDSLFLPLKDCKITAAQCVNDGKRLKFIQDKDGVLLKLGTVPDETDFIVELVLKQTTIK